MSFSHGKDDGQAAQGKDHGEGEQEVGPPHGHGEGGHHEVATHLHDAETLLQEADDKAQKQPGDNPDGGNHHPLDAEDAAYLRDLHPHAPQDGDVLLLVHDEQREGGHKVEGGDKHYERQYEVDAQPLAAEDFIVDGLLLETISDGEAVAKQCLHPLLCLGLGRRGEGDGQGGALVVGIVGELAHEADVGHHIAVVDVLLDIEVAARHSIGGVQCLFHGDTHGDPPFGDVHCHRHIGGFADAEVVVHLGPEDEEVELLSPTPGGQGVLVRFRPGRHGGLQPIDAFVEQGVEAGHPGVGLIDAAEGHDSLVVAVGDPGVFLHYLRHGGHFRHLLQLLEGHVGGVEGLAFGWLDEEFGVEGVEKALGEDTNAVIDAEHHNQCRGADGDADKGYPRDDIDDRLLLAGEEVAPGDEEPQMPLSHCLRSRSMFST